ncbi:MAG: GRP family sugar transporter [Candidatus Goldbacteria bacterium]|nr:GRP family sugar transporter [Candidatus Goldiibacteriota bacterium]
MREFLLAIFTALIWGFVPIIEKIGLSSKTAEPVASVIYRTVGSFVFAIGAFIFVLLSSGNINSLKNMDVKSIIILALAGGLASVFGQIFFYMALKNGNASVVTPVAGAFPMVTFIFGVLLLGEAITIPKVIGIILIITGVIFLK